ncbi:MAG: type II toxin-antitoxin system Phd/YefM family antitoxin [Chloroflexi bacterium]|nr:type II toxin-antitoxin system Phd/YefM family antitoxin [Chloroflexota bacterium]
MAKTLGIAQAKNQFSSLMSRNRDRVLVTRRGKPVGAIVSVKDFKHLEEDAENRQILKRARAIEKATKKYIPLEQFVRDYEKKWGVDLSKVEPEEF